jgi:hypothetical protein
MLIFFLCMQMRPQAVTRTSRSCLAGNAEIAAHLAHALALEKTGDKA